MPSAEWIFLFAARTRELENTFGPIRSRLTFAMESPQRQISQRTKNCGKTTKQKNWLVYRFYVDGCVTSVLQLRECNLRVVIGKVFFFLFGLCFEFLSVRGFWD